MTEETTQRIAWILAAAIRFGLVFAGFYLVTHFGEALMNEPWAGPAIADLAGLMGGWVLVYMAVTDR